MENFLPFTDDVMVVLVHKCAQQTHLLALHLETLGYIPRLLNALNGLVYFLIIGDPRGDKAVHSLWILFVVYAVCLSCCLVWSLQPCGHPLRNG